MIAHHQNGHDRLTQAGIRQFMQLINRISVEPDRVNGSATVTRAGSVYRPWRGQRDQHIADHQTGVFIAVILLKVSLNQ